MSCKAMQNFPPLPITTIPLETSVGECWPRYPSCFLNGFLKGKKGIEGLEVCSPFRAPWNPLSDWRLPLENCLKRCESFAIISKPCAASFPAPSRPYMPSSSTRFKTFEATFATPVCLRVPPSIPLKSSGLSDWWKQKKRLMVCGARKGIEASWREARRMVCKKIKAKWWLKVCEARHGDLEFQDEVKITGEDYYLWLGWNVIMKISSPLQVLYPV